jgi:3-methyladenine DNA glycosylase AlkC
MPDEASAPFVLKDWFNPTFYRHFAGLVAALEPKLEQTEFLRLVLEDLEQRELMARLQQTAFALNETLPGGYREKVAVLKALAPQLQHDFIAISLCDFVRQFGLTDFDFSLEALRCLTCCGSAEFAVRPFIAADQTRALETMLSWTCDPDEKVRRLASEGCRPMLTWGQRLTALVKDPSPLMPILEALKDDESLFVRRSVANNLNDISKHHAPWLLDWLSAWDLGQPELSWIAKHACRTLIKKGHPQALALFGFGEKPQLDASIKVLPETLRLGDRLHIHIELSSTSRKVQNLAIDYVVHYVKANASRSPKVFKWTEQALPASQTLSLKKTQVIKDFSTRKHHPGEHIVELQVNGQRVAQAAFVLE